MKYLYRVIAVLAVAAMFLGIAASAASFECREMCAPAKVESWLPWSCVCSRSGER